MDSKIHSPIHKHSEALDEMSSNKFVPSLESQLQKQISELAEETRICIAQGFMPDICRDEIQSRLNLNFSVKFLVGNPMSSISPDESTSIVTHTSWTFYVVIVTSRMLLLQTY